MLDVRSRMPDVGCQISDVGCRMSNLGFRMSDVGCRISDGTYKEGALGFSVLRFWLFFRSVFRSLLQKTSVFGFGGHCGLRIFRFLASGFRFS